MLVLSLYQPYSSAKGGFPIEWGFILLWSILGILFWNFARKVRSEISEPERRALILGGMDLKAKSSDGYMDTEVL